MSIKQEYEDYAARREALAKTHFGPIWLNPLDRYVHPFRIWGNVWYVGDSWVWPTWCSISSGSAAR